MCWFDPNLESENKCALAYGSSRSPKSRKDSVRFTEGCAKWEYNKAGLCARLKIWKFWFESRCFRKNIQLPNIDRGVALQKQLNIGLIPILDSRFGSYIYLSYLCDIYRAYYLLGRNKSGMYGNGILNELMGIY